MGAAVGLAPLTIGTETSGSILSPSVANSNVGIKPTRGLISRTGIVPIATSQDTAGPITKTVADAALLLTALTGMDPLDPATAPNPLVGHDFAGDLRADALRGARIGVVAGSVPAAATVMPVTLEGSHSRRAAISHIESKPVHLLDRSLMNMLPGGGGTFRNNGDKESGDSMPRTISPPTAIWATSWPSRRAGGSVRPSQTSAARQASTTRPTSARTR